MDYNSIQSLRRTQSTHQPAYYNAILSNFSDAQRINPKVIPPISMMMETNKLTKRSRQYSFEQEQNTNRSTPKFNLLPRMNFQESMTQPAHQSHNNGRLSTITSYDSTTHQDNMIPSMPARLRTLPDRRRDDNEEFLPHSKSIDTYNHNTHANRQQYDLSARDSNQDVSPLGIPVQPFLHSKTQLGYSRRPLLSQHFRQKLIEENSGLQEYQRIEQEKKQREKQQSYTDNIDFDFKMAEQTEQEAQQQLLYQKQMKQQEKQQKYLQSYSEQQEKRLQLLQQQQMQQYHQSSESSARQFREEQKSMPSIAVKRRSKSSMGGSQRTAISSTIQVKPSVGGTIGMLSARKAQQKHQSLSPVPVSLPPIEGSVQQLTKVKKKKKKKAVTATQDVQTNSSNNSKSSNSSQTSQSSSSSNSNSSNHTSNRSMSVASGGSSSNDNPKKNKQQKFFIKQLSKQIIKSISQENLENLVAMNLYNQQELMMQENHLRITSAIEEQNRYMLQMFGEWEEVERLEKLEELRDELKEQLSQLSVMKMDQSQLLQFNEPEQDDANNSQQSEGVQEKAEVEEVVRDELSMTAQPRSRLRSITPSEEFKPLDRSHSSFSSNHSKILQQRLKKYMPMYSNSQTNIHDSQKNLVSESHRPSMATVTIVEENKNLPQLQHRKLSRNKIKLSAEQILVYPVRLYKQKPMQQALRF